MALENSVAPKDSGVDIQELSNALLSSSTKRRLADLSRLDKGLADGCR